MLLLLLIQQKKKKKEQLPGRAEDTAECRRLHFAAAHFPYALKRVLSEIQADTGVREIEEITQ